VLFTPGLWVPLVNIQNTYILPGIPRLFQQMVEAHAARFQGPAAHERVLFTNMGEGGRARRGWACWLLCSRELRCSSTTWAVLLLLFFHPGCPCCCSLPRGRSSR
jgi:hypothetical protein